MLTIIGHIGTELFLLPKRLSKIELGGAVVGISIGALIAGGKVRPVARINRQLLRCWEHSFSNLHVDQSWLSVTEDSADFFVYNCRPSNQSKQTALESVSLSEGSDAFLLDTLSSLPIDGSPVHICSSTVEVQCRCIEILIQRGLKPDRMSISLFFSQLESDDIRQQLEFIARNVSLICVNEFEYEIVRKILRDHIIKTTSFLVSSGKNGARLILGSGIAVSSGQNSSILAVNNVGAGDVLHGAFIAGPWNTEPEKALSAAIEIASYSCKEYGVVHSLSRL